VNLNSFINLVLEIYEAFKAWRLFKRKEDLKDAAKTSLETKDQRPLESEIGVPDNGVPNYDGVRVVPRKKRP
jgi:hypothetical protein